MAWPPPTLPINRQNLTPQQATHPADHNAANLAINDLVAKINGDNAAGRLTALETRGGYIGTSSGIGYSSGFYGKIGPWVDSVNAGGVIVNGGSNVLTVTKAGAYAVTALFNAGTGIAGGPCDIILIAGPGGTFAAANLIVTKQITSVCAVRYFDVGNTISVEHYNGSTGSLTPFTTLMIERVSP